VKRILLSMFIAALSLGFAATSVEAKRLGGGMSQGMKRQAPPPQKAPDTPAQQAAPTQAGTPATAGAAAAAPKRSWMGPVAGLAAGLGLAALASHFGFGEGLANFMTIALLAIVAVIAIRFLMRRFGPKPAAANGMQFAGAGSAGNVPLRHEPHGFGSGTSGAAFAPAATDGPRTLSLPAGFDTAAFERAAKMIFIRMQAANDAANLDDLRQFSTPEMFAAFRLDLQDRKASTQRTDVVQLDAQVVDFAEEAGQQIVSVRYHGLIREEDGAPAEPFDEVWHLVKPVDGSREWAIAGIAQSAA
jgi:predicted lipid-binding transport protein (Tim44 family)